jgi:hypothetical protein
MRSLILLLGLGVVGCGAPSVDVPHGNDQVTSQAPAAHLNAPSVEASPGTYPFANIAIRGNAGGAARILVEGAGNPLEASVQPLDGTFCVNVQLAAAPAEYTLTLRSQAGDGRLSEPVLVHVDRANDAPVPKDATLCDGTPAKGG